MVSARTLLKPLVVSAAAVLGAAGCGSAGSSHASVPATRAAATTIVKPPLARFLLTVRGESGFTTETPVFLPTVSSFAAGLPDPQGAAVELRAAGFIAAAIEPLQGAGGPGVSNVQEFSSPHGARQQQAFELRLDKTKTPGVKLRFFPVPGVTNAIGFTETGLGSGGAVNIRWIEGRCQMNLGNQGASPVSLGRAEIASVQSIYRATNGNCP